MAESTGLADTVRRRLNDGASPESVIDELVSRGLSRPTAQRFVDRALAAQSATPPSAPPPLPSWTPAEPIPSVRPSEDPVSLNDLMRNPDAVAESQAFSDLTRGALMAAAGIGFTLLSMALPGRARLWYGLILGGIYFFGRGVARCTKLSRPFPWGRVLTAGAIPVVTMGLVFGYAEWRSVTAEKQKAADELAAADRARAKEIRADAAAKRERDNRAREADIRARLDGAMRELGSKQPHIQCTAALELGRSGSKEYVPVLNNLLLNSNYHSVRSCAAGALVSLGERSTAMVAYEQWATSDDPEERRSAIGGFGDIGPDAADVAIPFLTRELNSPHMDHRYIVVDSLAKLGPAARDLLVIASADPEQIVRDRANAALKTLAPQQASARTIR